MRAAAKAASLVLAASALGGFASPTGCSRTHLPRWQHVSTELADALAEGDAPDATTRHWESCWVLRLPHDHLLVKCPDGYRTYE